MNDYESRIVIILTFIFLFISRVTGAVDISFYGKVLDNEDMPVEGAYVTAQILTDVNDAEPQRLIVQSDDKGLFDIHASGGILEIISLRKKGYFFFKKQEEQYLYHYQPTDNNPAFIPAEDNPVLFHMDKQGKPEKILIYRTFRFRPDTESVYTIDLASQDKPRLKRAKIPEEILQIPEVRQRMQKKTRKVDFVNDSDSISEPNTVNDIQMTAVFTDDPNCILTIDALTPQTGIIMTDAVLTKAPDNDYYARTQIHIPLQETANPDNKCLFVKARNGEIVSQISLSLIPSPEELTVKAVIKSNLDGSAEFISSSFNNVPGAEEWNRQQQRMQKAREKHDIRNQSNENIN